jgi:hypothetical protein
MMAIQTAVSLDLLEKNFGTFVVDTVSAFHNFIRDREELSSVIKDLYFEKMRAIERKHEVCFDTRLDEAKRVFKEENKKLKVINLDAYREQKIRYLFNIERQLWEDEKKEWTKERLLAPIFLKTSNHEYTRDRWLEAFLQSANLDSHELQDQRFMIDNSGSLFLTWQNQETEPSKKPKPFVHIYRESIRHLKKLSSAILQGKDVSELSADQIASMKKEERTILLVRSLVEALPAVSRISDSIKKLKDACNFVQPTPRRHDRLDSGRRGFENKPQNVLDEQKEELELLLESHKKLDELKKKMPNSNINIEPVYYPKSDFKKLDRTKVDDVSKQLLSLTRSFSKHLKDFIVVCSVYVECDLEGQEGERYRIKYFKVIQSVFEKAADFSI